MTVQFLRIVPVSAEGLEAPFEDCGIVPIAVPEGRSPPAPQLVAKDFDPETGAGMLEVVCDGFDRARLRREEPGIFDGGPGASFPRVRIRRAVGGVTDPIYAKVLSEQDLTLVDTTDGSLQFRAEIELDPLVPFVRYAYWAEVQLPPERRAPPDVVLINPANGVTAVDPSAAQPVARPWSRASAPKVLMCAPAAGSAAGLGITARVTDPVTSQITIGLASAPVSHPKAVDQYRLAVWALWPGTSTSIASTGGASVWPATGEVEIRSVFQPPAGGTLEAVKLRVAIVDPLGRLGQSTDINVDPP
jgi:hypothetical protein